MSTTNADLPTNIDDLLKRRDIHRLTRRFEKLQIRIRQSERMTADDAHEAGELLARLKAKLPYGAWLPWLAHENFPQQTANLYMRIYRKYPVGIPGSRTVSDLTLVALDRKTRRP